MQICRCRMQGVNVCCARSTPPGFNANGTESLFDFIHSQPLILNFFLLKYARPLKCLGSLGGIKEIFWKKKKSEFL